MAILGKEKILHSHNAHVIFVLIFNIIFSAKKKTIVFKKKSYKVSAHELRYFYCNFCKKTSIKITKLQSSHVFFRIFFQYPQKNHFPIIVIWHCSILKTMFL